MLNFREPSGFDPSDTFVFELAAEPGEWACPALSVFLNLDLSTLGQKRASRCVSRFLGIDKPRLVDARDRHQATEAERPDQVMRSRKASCLIIGLRFPILSLRFSPPKKISRFAPRSGDQSADAAGFARLLTTAKSSSRFRPPVKPREAAPDADRCSRAYRAFTFHEVEVPLNPRRVEPSRRIKADRNTHI